MPLRETTLSTKAMPIKSKRELTPQKATPTSPATYSKPRSRETTRSEIHLERRNENAQPRVKMQGRPAEEQPDQDSPSKVDKQNDPIRRVHKYRKSTHPSASRNTHADLAFQKNYFPPNSQQWLNAHIVNLISEYSMPV